MCHSNNCPVELSSSPTVTINIKHEFQIVPRISIARKNAEPPKQRLISFAAAALVLARILAQKLLQCWQCLDWILILEIQLPKRIVICVASVCAEFQRAGKAASEFTFLLIPRGLELARWFAWNSAQTLATQGKGSVTYRYLLWETLLWRFSETSPPQPPWLFIDD